MHIFPIIFRVVSVGTNLFISGHLITSWKLHQFHSKWKAYNTQLNTLYAASCKSADDISDGDSYHINKRQEQPTLLANTIGFYPPNPESKSGSSSLYFSLLSPLFPPHFSSHSPSRSLIPKAFFIIFPFPYSPTFLLPFAFLPPPSSSRGPTCLASQGCVGVL